MILSPFTGTACLLEIWTNERIGAEANLPSGCLIGMNFFLCNPVINGFPANLAEQACLNNGYQFNLRGALRTVIAFHGLALTLVKTLCWLKVAPPLGLSAGAVASGLLPA
jgi:hypothetical protein